MVTYSKAASLKVLVVEDNPQVAELIKLYLKKDGHEVVLATDGEDGLKLALTGHPSIVLLDLMLPGISGMEVCRRIREHKDMPIIMITARIDEDARIAGLHSGADDYVTKPFSPRELMERVYAVMRRVNIGQKKVAGSPKLEAGPVKVDGGAHLATWNAKSMHLTRTEFRLLSFFVENNAKMVTREQIINAVFGYDYDGLKRTVDTHISHLRRKIEQTGGKPTVIEPVYGVGYRINFSA